MLIYLINENYDHNKGHFFAVVMKTHYLIIITVTDERMTRKNNDKIINSTWTTCLL